MAVLRHAVRCRVIGIGRRVGTERLTVREVIVIAGDVDQRSGPGSSLGILEFNLRVEQINVGVAGIVLGRGRTLTDAGNRHKGQRP